MSASQDLQALARVVMEDADTQSRRLEDRCRNEARALVEAAHAHVAQLRDAVRALGRTRGMAATAALAREAAHEIEAIHAGSYEALEERFRRRITLAVAEVRADPARYAAALRAWAKRAAPLMTVPCDIGVTRSDRAAVYEALLEAGAEDFHVVHDPLVHMGFVVRDQDGRTVFDARPEALADSMGVDLAALLRRHVAPFDPDGEAREDALPP